MRLPTLSRERPMPSLLAFISAWVEHLGPEHRLQPEAIPQFVPGPLRQLYELTGNYPIASELQWRPPDWVPGLFGPQDQLLPPDQLRVSDGRFTFVHENQGVWRCETLADHDDPPVFSDSEMLGHQGMHEVCNTLSHFLVTFCLQELAFGALHLFCLAQSEAKPEDCVIAPLSELWLEAEYAYGAPTHSFYTCADEMLVMGAHGDLWFACNSSRGFALLAGNVQVECLR